MKKIKTIDGRMTRELESGIDMAQNEKYEELLLMFNQILSQHRHSKDKIYSKPEPHVKCIDKGKEAKIFLKFIIPITPTHSFVGSTCTFY